MARYEITLHLTASRMPDAHPEPAAFDPGKDPMTVLAQASTKVFERLDRPIAFPTRPAGVETSKSFEVAAESFLELAKILDRFDSLAELVADESRLP